MDIQIHIYEKPCWENFIRKEQFGHPIVAERMALILKLILDKYDVKMSLPLDRIIVWSKGELF
jgi:hypothetical protein